MKCPQCATETNAHPNRGYYGEMREMPELRFMAYNDQWHADGRYTEPTNDPF